MPPASAVSAAAVASHLAPTAQQHRGMRVAVAVQCLYAMAWVSVSTGIGVVLLYLKRRGFGDEKIVLYLTALPALSDALLRLVFAYLGDRVGKKRVGSAGTVLTAVGFTALTLSAFFTSRWAEWLIVLGLLCFAVGNSMFSSVWFALLSPIVPTFLRGRFFGWLRLTWQAVGIVFTIVCALFLFRDASLRVYQAVLALMSLLVIARVAVYLRLPELEKVEAIRERPLVSLRRILQAPGYASFCAYVFLLSLFTGGCPVIFGLILKGQMGLSDGWVLGMGILLMFGSMSGFFLGGKAVDRWGTKPVFLICHFSFAAVLLLFVARTISPAAVLAVAAGASFLWGLVLAASGIAISSEMLALIPPQNKALSTSLCTCLQYWGMALAGLLVSASFKLGLLAERWSVLGWTLSQYDTVLLGCAVMVVLMVVTLGLVPSVLGKAAYMPRMEGG